MIEKHRIDKLILSLIFISAGYLFFANIRWFAFNFVNKHEIDFYIFSSRLIESSVTLDFKDFFTVIYSQGQHPFLPVLLFAFFRFFFEAFNFNEFIILKLFYFFCYSISLIYVYRLALLYAPRKKILSGVIAILYALSTSFYYQTLFEGQAPEDLVANIFLLLCLYSYACYRKALDEKQADKILWKAVFLSLAASCCFFSKYNVGIFIMSSIVIDLFFACYIFKTYSIKEIKVFYVIIPFFALVMAWFLSPAVRGEYFSYMSQRLASEGALNIFYYIELLLAQNKPFVHSVEGIWKHKPDMDMFYFYHWGEGIIALVCLFFSYKGLAEGFKKKRLSDEQKIVLLPLIYIAVNFLFFSFSNYRRPTALISTIPVIWLITGYKIAEFSCFCGDAGARGGFLQKIIRRSVIIFIPVYLFTCFSLQYLGLNNQILYFMNRNNTKQLLKDSERAAAQIKKFALDNNCVAFISMQRGVSFFEEYFSKFLKYRLLSELPSVRFINEKGIKSLLLKDKENVLFIEITSGPLYSLFSKHFLSELGDFNSGEIGFDLKGQAYKVYIYSFSNLQLKSAIGYLNGAGNWEKLYF